MGVCMCIYVKLRVKLVHSNALHTLTCYSNLKEMMQIILLLQAGVKLWPYPKAVIFFHPRALYF